MIDLGTVVLVLTFVLNLIAAFIALQASKGVLHGWKRPAWVAFMLLFGSSWLAGTLVDEYWNKDLKNGRN